MKKIVSVLIAIILFGVAIFFVFVFLNKNKVVKIENSFQEADGADGSTSSPQDTVEVEARENQESLKDEDNKIQTEIEQNDSVEANEAKKEAIEIVPEKKEEASLIAPSELKIKNNLVSFGFQKASERKIDTIIIHSSYDALGKEPYSVSGLIAEYKEYGVVAHYLIDRQGTAYRLVEEKNIAYHAGESKVPDGRSGVNAFSIGIEMMNTKTDKYTSAQYASLKNLLTDIKKRYKIKYTLGHKDIAPGRKDDPWNFNWDKL